MSPSRSSGPCFPIITNIFGDHVILMYKQLGLRDLKKKFFLPAMCKSLHNPVLPNTSLCCAVWWPFCFSLLLLPVFWLHPKLKAALCVVERPWSLPPGYFRPPLKPQIHGLSRRTFQKMEKLTRDRLWETRRNEKRKPCLDIYL